MNAAPTEAKLNEILPLNVKYVLVILNMKCFFRCKMCDIWKNKNQGESLDKSIYRQFFSDLRKISGPKTYINLGGGELLMNENIFNIISYSSENGFNTNLNTNGWLLDNKKVKELFDSGIKNIGLSLDGSTPRLHDYIRGYPGSFDKVFDASKKLKQYFESRGKKINITVCFTVMSYNLNDAINTVMLVQDNNYIDSIVFGAVTQPFAGQDKLMGNQPKYWFEKKPFLGLWPKDKEQVNEVYSALIDLKKKAYKIGNHENRLKMQNLYFTEPHKRLINSSCTVNRNLIIEQNGDVYHCNIKKELIGNIKKKPIHQIWRSFQAIKMRKRVLKCNSLCHELINCDSEDARIRL